MERHVTSGGSVRANPTSAGRAGAEELSEEFDQRVAITLGVSDGFKFGCGLILAGVAFYFALIIVVAFALLVALILNLPLPFGMPGR
ncbi:MAG TPA: hypothetical protein VKX96_12425 [Chloroflexota bacterium]|nr:hypothetical protein [Chloroflexota bacterium]